MSEHTLPEEDRVRASPGAWRLWFALLGASVAWAVHFIACYLLLEVACRAGWQQFTVVGLNGVAAAVLLTTLLCLPVVVASGIAAWRALRADGAATITDDSEEVSGYLSRAGLILSALFLLAIIAETIPALVLAPCGYAS